MSELLARLNELRHFGYSRVALRREIRDFMRSRYQNASKFGGHSEFHYKHVKPLRLAEGTANRKYIALGKFARLGGTAINALRNRGVVCTSCHCKAEIGNHCADCHDKIAEIALAELGQYLAAFIPFPPDEIRTSIVANFNGFYPALSREKDNHIAYSRTGTISVCNHDRRVRLRLSRFLRRAFTQSQLSDHALDSCVRQLNLGEFRLKMKPFETTDYEECPIESCMTGSESNLTRIYEDPKIQFLAWYLGDTENAIMVARALLFTSDDGQTKFLARVYNNSEYLASEDVSAFREKQASLIGAITSLPRDFSCTVSHDRGDDMPYIDNLNVLRVDCHTVRLGYRGESCQSTDGSDPTSGTECENCGSFVPDDETVSVYTSRRDTATWCDSCAGEDTYIYNGEYYSNATGQTVTIPEWESLE